VANPFALFEQYSISILPILENWTYPRSCDCKSQDFQD
jgi:hypothetical protein